MVRSTMHAKGGSRRYIPQASSPKATAKGTATAIGAPGGETGSDSPGASMVIRDCVITPEGRAQTGRPGSRPRLHETDRTVDQPPKEHSMATPWASQQCEQCELEPRRRLVRRHAPATAINGSVMYPQKPLSMYATTPRPNHAIESQSTLGERSSSRNAGERSSSRNAI